jgi:hypothetical protein
MLDHKKIEQETSEQLLQPNEWLSVTDYASALLPKAHLNTTFYLIFFFPSRFIIS